MQDQGLKQQHGGDDDPEQIYEEEEAKPKLDKYLHASDHNLTDLFERIIKMYLDDEDPSNILEKIKYERMTLLRAGIKSVERGLPHLNISKNMIAYYLGKMILDQNWNNVFKTYITETYSPKTKYPVPVIIGLNKVFKENKEKFTKITEEMIMDLNNEEIMSLINELHNDDLTKNMKKHLLFIARDDIARNKNNAINSLVDIVNEDDEVAKLFVLLLKRRDEETHKFVLLALSLKKEVKNEELREQIKKFSQTTDNPHLKEIAKRILG